ncbi:MAG TPA: chemotaxis protein CheW [Armatimonadota bacterium]|jgi:purine-binding chemotaxis protein CheW
MTTMTAPAQKIETLVDEEEQLVVFLLDDGYYGVMIEVVNTIIRLPQITRVPHAPAFVEGVMNLRGSIIPIIDLRKRLALPVIEATKATRIIVVEQGDILVGIIVDAVTETLRLPMANVEPLCSLVTSIDAQYLRGVGKIDDRLIILLALEHLLSGEESATLGKIVQRAERITSPKAASAVTSSVN